MHLLDYVILGKTELWHNFNVLMQYLTFPWVGHLSMPDFPSSESGLKHFHDVKWLFHLVQGLVILLAYPAVTSLWRNVKKGTFGLYIKLYMSLALLPVLIGVVGLFLGFDEFLRSFMKPSFLGIAVGSLIPCWTRLSTFCQKSISFSVLSFSFLFMRG